MGYALNVTVVSSDSNGDDEGGEEAINDELQEDIRANLDADGFKNEDS